MSTLSTSTPLATKQERKRKKVKGSEFSIEGDLSYLDLDTGRIQTASRHDEGVVDFDKMMNNLDMMQTKFSSKLDKLDKLDDKEKCVRAMNVKVRYLESRVTQAESATTELQQSVSFVSDQYDTILKQHKADQGVVAEHSGESIDQIKKENKDLKKSLKYFCNLNSELKSEMSDIKCRSVRDNLIVTNIPEHLQVNNNCRSFEDTETVLSKFIEEELNITNLQFERVHRIPKSGSYRKTAKPIVAKFSFFKDRETVRRSGWKLQGKDVSIREQFPDDVERKRRELYPLVRHYKGNNHRVALIRDRLFVDGKEVRSADVVLPERSQNRQIPSSRGRQQRYSTWSTSAHPYIQH